MIKKITENIVNKFAPNLSEEHKKWINVFNEIQSRIDILFEALVSWHSGLVFLIHLDNANLNERRTFMPLGLKMHIFEGYLYIELLNLLDSSGDSSITKFVNHWTNNINKGGKGFTEIFQENNNFEVLLEHFKIFKKWLKDNKAKIDHFRYMRNKNFSHIDHDFKYVNKVSFEYMIETIAFLSDYSSKLAMIMKMLNIKVVKGEPVGTQKYLIQTLNLDILRFRFRQEIEGLSNYYGMTGEGRKIFLLNCFDSIEETLKKVNLISI